MHCVSVNFVQSYELASVIIPVLQSWYLVVREMKPLAQDHKAGKS